MAYAHRMRDVGTMTMTLHTRAKLRYYGKSDDDDEGTDITMRMQR
jgi:hypothetical protein